MDTDVLVVGAGPTGLLLANELARRGARAIVVDRLEGPSRETRALGVHARTLEIYARLGIAERAVELGRPAVGANLWSRGRRTARIPLGEIGRDLSPYPFVLILGQDDNERLLIDALARHGSSVRWSTELVALDQESERVVATVRDAGGATREISAAWLAGCDGAHSAVRELAGVAFRGAAYEHVFFVADTRATGPMVAGEINVFLWRNGFHLLFPMRGEDHWRVVGILPAELRGRDDVTFEHIVPSLRAEIGPRLDAKSCTWFSTYRIHHRRAERFRAGRAFLLGDAAHVHSPVGAQGMNTGLQDAYNLGWKLALVVRGRASERLLDSYAAERIPVADRLLRTTDRAFSLVVSDRRPAALVRARVVARLAALAMRSERVRRLAFRTISQIGIRYRASLLSQTLAGLPAGAPRAGDRFPWLRVAPAPDAPADLYAALDDARFTLLVVGQPPPDGVPGCDDLVSVLALPDDAELERARLPRPSFWLLRPDGHVGLAGGRYDAAAVARYLRERAGLS